MGPNHPTIPSQDAWEQARERYVEDLTEEEKCLYDQATPETLFYNASADQKKYTAGSTTFAVTEKLQPLRDAIEQYGQAMDVYCNAYPLVLSPLWGSIRVLLHIAGEFSKYFEKLVDMFERIGDVLPRFRVYERLFSNHERLIQALSVAYVDIITFCSKCKTVFRQGQRHSKTTFKVAFKLTWKPFERQFGQVIDSFRIHRKNVEEEVGLSHMIEAADSRSLVVANQLQLEQQRRADAHRAILAAIPTVDTGAKHRKLQGLRYPGTGEWLLQDDVYNAWLIAENSSYICCHGIPGCGKSVLASTVIDSLLEVEGLKVVYFYCDYSDQRTLQIHRILGTILKQLFIAARIPDEIEERVIQTFADVSTSPAPKELVSLVCSAINMNPAVAVVLDGLDECEQDVKDQMLAFLERLKIVGSTVIKLFVFCREEDRLLRTLTQYLRIRVTSTASERDIGSFVRGSVRSRIEAGKLRLRNGNLEQEIVSILADKANGMFLWVFFQLEDLCDTHSDAEIRETLNDLPDGIFATYDRILSKIIKRRTRNVANKMFTWITSAQRPLTSAELQEAVAFDTSDKAWDETKIPHEDLMIESCNGLVVRDEIDSTVRLAHYTIQQYLFSSTTRHGTDHVNIFSLHNKENYVGHMCITYLNFSDFETQITHQKPAQGLEASGILASGGPVLIPSVLGVKKFIFDFAYRLSGCNPVRPTPVIDWTERLKAKTVRKNELPTDFTSKYALLQYVIDYWVYHTKGFIGDDGYSRKLQDLAYNRDLPFEFRPWGPNEHWGPYGCVSCPIGHESQSLALRYMSLFHYAAEAGHWLLMEPFVVSYCAHEVHTEETFLIACRHDQDFIVDRLLSTGISFRESTGRAVSIAATLGHARVLGRLLTDDKYNPPHALTSGWLAKPLSITATSGLEEAVNVLCKIGADVNSRDERSGRTPLASAAMNGHVKIIEALLRWDAKIEDEDSVDSSALYLASETGNSSVVQMLLQAATSGSKTHLMENNLRLSRLIDATTMKGYTALHKAAEQGNERVVEILVEYRADEAKRTFIEASPYPETEMYRGRYLAMHLAAMRGHVGVLGVLSQGRFSVDAITAGGGTALHLAAAAGHESVVSWLILNEAAVDVRTSAGDTALHLAAAAGHEPVVRFLVTNHADINAVNHKQRYTPIKEAASRGHAEVVLALLDLRADSKGVLVESIKFGCYTKDQWLLSKLLEHPRLGQDRQELERGLAYANLDGYKRLENELEYDEAEPPKYRKATEILQSALDSLDTNEGTTTSQTDLPISQPTPPS